MMVIGGPVGLGILSYGEGAGCACKADWRLLEKLADLPIFREAFEFQVGLRDAAIVGLAGRGPIATSVDFIGPVSRSAFDYGFIAACHALSDLFAVGVAPAFGVVIAAWPHVEAVEARLGDALNGMHEAASVAGVRLVGGHTVYSEQPLLGLCAFGATDAAQDRGVIVAGDCVYLSKALGTGIAIGAMRERACPEELEAAALGSMKVMNQIGLQLAIDPGVKLVSDVTGFGLLGQVAHLVEETGLGVEIEGGRLPAFPGARPLIESGVGIAAATRNLEMLRPYLPEEVSADAILACDPQTNGPLLIVADDSFEPARWAPPDSLVRIGRIDRRGAAPIVMT